ncbi:MAG TPA: trehalose-6-phosphate synthase, partial [Hyphomonadaceae bacterium]|nr:trehalose-6-phosphate synthase [Hyphomonadaceae bacterium]
MSRLIVVSNRVNPPDDPGVASAGGLAMALAAALRDDKGIWFGWSGEITEQFTGIPSIRKIGGVTVALVDLEEQDRAEYYDGFANRTLWPLFHTFPARVHFNEEEWRCYQDANRAFAAAARELVAEDTPIWLHDYHLLLAGRSLRRLGH